MAEGVGEQTERMPFSLHPRTTKIVSCKDSNRRGRDPQISFDCLGDTFRPRSAKAKPGRRFTGYTPALSRKALKRIGDTVRRWKLQRWSGHTIEDMARALNPVIAGWVNDSGHFGRKERDRIQNLLDFARLSQMGAEKGQKAHPQLQKESSVHGKTATAATGAMCSREPAIGWLNKKSRMNREIHVRFCEGLRVKLPRATRPPISPPKKGNYILD